jgi:gliding motility-associated-like protein
MVALNVYNENKINLSTKPNFNVNKILLNNYINIKRLFISLRRSKKYPLPMKPAKYFLFLILLVLFQVVNAQMGFHNNGLKIKIESGAFVNVGDFTDSIVSDSIGTIDIDGNLIINGNLTNNSYGNVFINIPSVPNGNIILAGNNQTIQGTTPIFFENLIIKNQTKTLALDSCQVKGIFTVDGVMDLNHERLFLDNGTPAGMVYQSGFLKSETTPSTGLGEIDWNIGSNIGSYAVPFGSGAGGNDLNLVLETKTAASPGSGSIVFATYSASNNQPFPPGISSLDTFKSTEIADRYWEVFPNYTNKPDVVLNFKYTEADVANIPDLIETNLEAIRYNDIQNTWLDMKMTGTCDVADKIVTTPVILGTDYFTWWTLSEFQLKIPNAFIPLGNDQANAVFLPGYNIKIFNRWDQVLYQGTDGWNGTYKGSMVSPGTYFYTASIPDYNNQMKTIKGVIMLIAPK